MVTPHDDIRALIARSLNVLSCMVEQVKGFGGEINDNVCMGEFDTYRLLAELVNRKLIEEVKRRAGNKPE